MASVLDLFCGVGGLSHGFRLEGFDIAAGVDIDEHFRHGYEANNDAPFLRRDVAAMTAKDIDALFGPADSTVLIGCAPCQPFSTAGKRKGQADERHLWPEMFRLVRECKPAIVFGEQVEGAIRHGWLDGVFGGLEGEGYACGAAVLGAHSVGAPHIRQRLYWLADVEHRRPAIEEQGAESRACVGGGGLGHSAGDRSEEPHV